MTSASKILALSFVVLSILCSGKAHAISTFGTEHEPVQAYGDSTYSGVGRLELSEPKGAYCSAFLISRTWAVTAAHCIADATPVTLSFEVNSGTAFEFTTTLARTFAAPNYQTGLIRPNDWALLELTTPAPEQYRSYRLAKPSEVSIDLSAISVGYPLRVDAGGSTRIVGQNCSVKGFLGDQILSDCDMTIGNSGGPLLALLPSGDYVAVGVASTQTLGPDNLPIMWGTYSDAVANHWTSIPAHLSEILKVISRAQ